jgi:uncharacterized protein YjbI with pentapeptide repeats
MEEILRLHKLWTKDENEGVRANFEDKNLESINLEGESLNCAFFINANLKNANFKNASLENADFTDANLEGANFIGADLLRADFTGANLKNVNFIGADLTNVIFCKATIDGAIVNKDNIGGPGWILYALTKSEAKIIEQERK